MDVWGDDRGWGGISDRRMELGVSTEGVRWIKEGVVSKGGVEGVSRSPPGETENLSRSTCIHVCSR